ncbi:hypothetical protein BBJ29_008136 [Phytophthora kernoviae]|uniref:Uncharacterized protein n=1 Tax=Phytophthora kernoviae TaxID=325452 RepID=A0A3F2RGB3_9STRA|nr:hypothetical protein BBJ29_008136 [Phytophthora kernoviae]RLN55913.1 hypothetical protein BBP00_00008268 [Phytophthora kernoviae]
MQDHAETLEAFYDRVMSRVCEEYRKEAEAQSLDVVDLLEQKWREKLMRYTGWRYGSGAVTSNEISVARALSPVDAASSGNEEEEDDVSSSVSSAQASPVAAVAAPVIGQPIAQLPIAAVSTSSSVFTKMLGGKRKLHQLDGLVSDDDEDEDEDQKTRVVKY